MELQNSEFPPDLPVFELLTQRHKWERFSGGCYGSVYHPCEGSEWIVKLARNDGTRTYLEWCLWREKTGRKMKGMPEIDFLISYRVGNDENYYLVAMRRYTSLRDKFDEEEDRLKAITPAKDRGESSHYLRKLVLAFEEETGIQANDLHTGNFLYDERSKTYILTDPSSRGYHPLGANEAAMTLH